LRTERSGRYLGRAPVSKQHVRRYPASI
jgi:hypothetical protein